MKADYIYGKKKAPGSVYPEPESRFYFKEEFPAKTQCNRPLSKVTDFLKWLSY
jgi:hypothetical protein